MDRNYKLHINNPTKTVALRKESVDRNLWWGVRKAVGSLSLSARRAWIEITSLDDILAGVESLSARRAWIEIKYVVKDSDFSGVALRKESVDRNTNCTSTTRPKRVALRKESVDRNLGAMQIVIIVVVALRKESVDRNSCWLLA